MNEINIVTAQNVTLKIELANIGDRFVAALLDTLIKIGLLLLAALVIAGVEKVTGSSVLSVLLYVVCFAGLFFYSLLFEYFWQGQTPGKRTMKIKVARQDGEAVSFGSLLLRWVFRVIDFPISWPAIGITSIVVTKKFQRLGDLVAGTILVSTKERTSLQDTFYTAVESNYIPVYVQAAQLSGKDVEVIKKVTHLYVENDKYDLMQETAQKVRQVLDIQADMDDLNFLKTILKDYSYADALGSRVDTSYQP